MGVVTANLVRINSFNRSIRSAMIPPSMENAMLVMPYAKITIPSW